MAEFNRVIMTQNGLRLIELSQGMSKPLSFTKIMMGDGTPGAGEDITAYTALKNPKLTASITNIKPITASASTEARWAVYGTYSNSTLSKGFYIKEAGLYAKVEASNYDDKGWDGYAGEELLIGYVSAKEGKADWLPAASVAQETQEIVFYSSVGNASSVTAYIPEDSFVTHDDLAPVAIPIVNKVGTDHITRYECWKSGHVVQVNISAVKIDEARHVMDNVCLSGFPKPFSWLYDVECPFNTSAIIRWALTTDGNFGWHYTSAWEKSSGHELEFTFTYLTAE